MKPKILSCKNRRGGPKVFWYLFIFFGDSGDYGLKVDDTVKED